MRLPRFFSSEQSESHLSLRLTLLPSIYSCFMGQGIMCMYFYSLEVASQKLHNILRLVFKREVANFIKVQSVVEG